MNPLPVVVCVCVLVSRTLTVATGVRRAWFMSCAPGVPSHATCPAFDWSWNAGNGGTQKMSVHVSKPLLLSNDALGARPANDESFMMPHDALTVALNGTGTLCTSSTTESIAPAAPQYTLKSAARMTVAVTASRSRIGKLRTVL